MISEINSAGEKDFNSHSLVETDLGSQSVKYHFCWIINLSRLVSTQTNKSKEKLFICDRCQNYFSN